VSDYYKEHLIWLLENRKDKRYRAGLLQAAVSFDVITQKEWVVFSEKYETMKHRKFWR
jgi:hypothetical protein